MSQGNGQLSMRCGPVDAAGAAIAIALSAVFCVTVMAPALNHRQAAAAQRKHLNLVEQQAATVQSEVQEAQVKAAALKQCAVGPALEPTSALNRRLANIAALAVGHRLDLATIQPGAPAAASRYVALPISLSGTGSFSDCVKYLHELHEKLPDVAVASVSLTAGAEIEGRGAQATFVLELRWYAAGRAAGQTAPGSSEGT